MVDGDKDSAVAAADADADANGAVVAADAVTVAAGTAVAAAAAMPVTATVAAGGTATSPHAGEKGGSNEVVEGPAGSEMEEKEKEETRRDEHDDAGMSSRWRFGRQFALGGKRDAAGRKGRGKAGAGDQRHGDEEAKNKDDDGDDDDDEKTPAPFSNYLRIFQYSNRTDRILLALTTFAAIATGVTMPLMNILFGKLAGDFATYFRPDAGVDEAAFRRALNKKVLLMVAIFIVRWVCSYLEIFVFRIVGLRISAKLRLNYLESLFHLPISTLDRLPTGLASNAITNAANIVQIGISDKLGLLVQFTSLIVASVVISFIYSWALTLVTSSSLLFILVIYSVIVPIATAKQRAVDEADGQASAVAGEVLGNVRMIKALEAETTIEARYRKWTETARRRGMTLAIWIGAQFAPIFFAIFCAHALCFWYGFKLLWEGHIKDISEIVIVLMGVLMLAFSLGQTAGPILAISKATSAATMFFSIIDLPRPARHGLKEPDVCARDDIVFDDVTFAYPSRPNVRILDRLSLTFRSGKVTAIVGPSGTGKSTIVGLLQRWYELDTKLQMALPRGLTRKAKKDDTEDTKPDQASSTYESTDQKDPIELSGSVKCGSHNLADIDITWWRNQIGLVAQEPFIFNASITENIAYGLVGSEWEHVDSATKQQLVEDACKEAFADEFINKLPLVGDGGIKLSGGQRQRLAIARSIVKRPKILILDEATSAIDVRGERIVQAALDRVSAGRTTIIIAHRLSTIKKADTIMVLKRGALIEQGTHDELLANRDGVYWALVNAQQLSLGEPSEDGAFLKEKAIEQIIEEEVTADKQVEVEDPKYQRVGLLRSFGKLIWEQRAHWPWYSVLLIACAGAAASNPLSAYFFANLINVFTIVGPGILSASRYWALRYFILAIGVGVSYYLGGLSGTVTSSFISSTYRQQYFEGVVRKPIKFFDHDENSSGTLVSRLANDPTQLQQLLGMNSALVLIAIFNIIGGLILAFYYGWKLSLVVTFTALPIIIGSIWYRVHYELVFEKLNNEVFAESSKFAAEALSAFRTVTSLTLEDVIIKRYEKLLDGHIDTAFKKARITSILFAASDSFSILCMALAFWYGGRLLASREYDPVVFFVVYICIVNGSEAAGSFLGFSPNASQTSAAANRILSLRDSADTIEKPFHELENVQGGLSVEFRDVWFQYPARDVPVLKGLSISVEKGQFVGLVGASGCGKTTCVSLLERFYDPNRGAILINGHPIADIISYRSHLSLVAQEPALFQGTIKSNILLGVPNHITVTDEHLHSICRSASIHDFVMSLPDGYETEIGSKGTALSGGQRQRISIARALIRDPSLLLLDEATSSLDSESEKQVQAAFELAGRGRTMVVVAHRLATIQHADVIL